MRVKEFALVFALVAVVVWLTRPAAPPIEAAPTPPSSAWKVNGLSPGMTVEALREDFGPPGEDVTSEDGRYTWWLTADGRLTRYEQRSQGRQILSGGRLSYQGGPEVQVGMNEATVKEILGPPERTFRAKGVSFYYDGATVDLTRAGVVTGVDAEVPLQP